MEQVDVLFIINKFADDWSFDVVDFVCLFVYWAQLPSLEG